MNKLCRACLVSKESFTYVLFENVLPDIYCFCTSLEVHQDNLPRALCDDCYELLVKYSDFKKTCIQSQNKLLECQSDLKSEIEDIKLKVQDEKDDTVKKEYFADQFQNDTLDAECSDEVIKNFKKKTIKVKKKHKRKEQKLTNSRDYKCNICNKKFNFLERFEAHKLEHQGKKVAIHCTPCNKTYRTWNGLKRHYDNEHTKVRLESLKCNKCGKVFKNRQTLMLHDNIHGERSMCVCDVCGKGFISAISLKTHLETHKVNRKRPFACQNCNKKFFTKSTLMSHMMRLHTGRRYICHICNYPFTDKYNLSKHLLIHNGKKLFKCDICDKSYSSQYTLVVHKRIHSGERPFSCSYCPKAFISNTRLLDHHRVHTGERPFRCSTCNQTFTQSGSLKRHMKVHGKMTDGMKN